MNLMIWQSKKRILAQHTSLSTALTVWLIWENTAFTFWCLRDTMVTKWFTFKLLIQINYRITSWLILTHIYYPKNPCACSVWRTLTNHIRVHSEADWDPLFEWSWSGYLVLIRVRLTYLSPTKTNGTNWANTSKFLLTELNWLGLKTP